MKIDTKEIREKIKLDGGISVEVTPLVDRIDELENMLKEMLDDEADSATWAKAINVLEGE